MRRVTAALTLFGLMATPALAQPDLTQPAPVQSATPASPSCACTPPSPRPATYHRPAYRRRPATPVPSFNTSVTPGPFVFAPPQEVRFAPPPLGGYAQFDTSGTFSGLGPNGLGLEDGSINDGIMGGPAGSTGPGPFNIGW